jgi:cell division protease FtsH
MNKTSGSRGLLKTHRECPGSPRISDRMEWFWRTIRTPFIGRSSLLPGGSKLFFILTLILVIGFLARAIHENLEHEISYADFLSKVELGQVTDLLISEHRINGVISQEAGIKSPFFTLRVDDPALVQRLSTKNITFRASEERSDVYSYLLMWLFPFMLMAGLMFLFLRQLQRGGGGWFGRRKRIIPLVQGDSNRLKFDDVAGTREAKQELQEAIAFLKDPRKIQRLGGRMPKGLLLVGAPGTGKTLLARAVAGEAGVPFYNISGAEFMEIFVGVGAARVRELFEQAREHAPCMIFIDELDAIGRSRGGANPIIVHDEREQTLNQLLTEMDGFDPSLGIIVMAATNRPEILDRALLRSGRFDRQIVVDKPCLEDREDILKLHARSLILGTDVNLQVIARRTAGLVGADLANICNEAAIHAVRDDAQFILMKHFESALERVIAGPEKRSILLSLNEKERVACHEAGHALVAELLPNSEPVQKVSIIPRGAEALGFTLQLPIEERFFSTEPQLLDQITVLLAGRAAEKMQFGNYSNGAANDLESATAMARKMVCEWGMSPTFGPVALGHHQRLFFLEREGGEQRDFSEISSERIDSEIHRILGEAEGRAVNSLSEHKGTLLKIIQQLMEHEEMNGTMISGWIRKERASA